MKFEGGTCPKCGSTNCYWEKGVSEMTLATCRRCGYRNFDIRKFGIRVVTKPRKVDNDE